MTTRLKKVSIRACKSIVGPVDIEFPETGLVLVRGKNLETGGSSGSGKSSVFNAITYALDFAPFSATALQNWDANEKLQVDATFDNERGPVYLRRGAKTSLQYGSDKAFQGSVKIVNEKLQELLGLPSTLMKALTYRGQKKPSLFLSMKDEEKKEFLAAVLGLDKLEAVAEAAQLAAKEHANAVKEKQAVVASLQSLLTEQQSGIKEPSIVDTTALQTAVVGGERMRNALETAFAQKKRAVLQLQEEHAALTASTTEKYRERVREAKEVVRTAEHAVQPDVDSSAWKQAQELLANCDSRLSLAIFADEQRRESRAKKIEGIIERRTRAEMRAMGLPAAEKRAEELRIQARQLQEHTCPTCEREWADSGHNLMFVQGALASVEENIRDLKEAKAEAHKLDVALMDIEPFTADPNISKLEELRKKLAKNVTNQDAIISNAHAMFLATKAKRVAAAKEAHSALLLEIACDRELTDSRNRLVVAVSEKETLFMELANAAEAAADAKDALDELESTQTKMKAVFDAAVAAVAKTQQRLAQAVAECASAQEKYAAEADFVALVGRDGFLGAIFDEVLIEIADETNRVLGAIPNTSFISMRFVSETVNGKGTVKRSIVPLITVRGHEAVFEAGCSGGQQTAVELAVDLAIVTVVSRRTGVTPGWMILDEAFNGLGPIEMESCLEILQKFAHDRLVLVVDHATEFQEMFTKTIDLEFSNGVTTVRK